MLAGLVSLSMIHSEQRSLCGPQPLVVLPKGGSVENGAEGCTDRGCMEVGSDNSSCKEGRKVDRELETPLEGGLSSGEERAFSKA